MSRLQSWVASRHPLPSVCLCGDPRGPYLQDVVARAVTVVSDTDLCAHVPATEGTGAELQAADLQQHIGHGGEAVPLQAQVFEPVKPGGVRQPSSARGKVHQ